MTINDQMPSAKRFAIHKQDHGGTRLHISAGGFLLYVLCIRPRDQSGGSECVCVGEDSPFGAISSIIQDPLTGYAIHKLRYGPIEVSSRIGFEGVSAYEVGTYVNYTTTIVNGSDSTLSIRTVESVLMGVQSPSHGLFSR